jgi:nicotinamidase-related amidase
MNENSASDRSPELMSVGETALLVIDVQEKLAPAIPGQQRVVWNIRRLLDGAETLGVPALATVQYPKGLGPLVGKLASRIEQVVDKEAFSCWGCAAFIEHLKSLPVYKVLVTGIEAHVCVQQTVLDLMAAGYSVYVAVDAVGSRGAIDCETALRRMESSGATLTTTEAALFEWCQVAGTPEFKAISKLIKESQKSE